MVEKASEPELSRDAAREDDSLKRVPEDDQEDRDTRGESARSWNHVRHCTWSGKRTPGSLGFEPRVDADFCLEQLRNRAARFRGLNRCVELGLVRARNFSDQVEMTLGDGEAVREFFERNGSRRLQFLCGQSRVAELRGKRHREAPRMRRSKEFLGICADPIFKSRAERILRLLQ